MAKKYLSLEEAAAQIGITEEQLKDARARGDIRGFNDRGSWKFRPADLDEYARTIQADSSPEVPIFGGDNVLDDDDEIAEQPTKIRRSDSNILTDDDLAGTEGTSDSGVRLVFDQDLVSDQSDDSSSVDIPVSLGDSSEEMDLIDDDGDSSGSVAIPLSLGDSAEELHLDLDEGDSGDLALDLDRSDSDVKLASEADDESLADSSADVLISGQVSDSDVRLLAQDTPRASADLDSDVLSIDGGGSGSDIALASDIRVINTDSDSDVKLVGADSDSDVRLLPAAGESDSDVKLGDTEAGIVLEAHADDESGMLELGGDSGIALDVDPDSGISLDMADDSGIALDVGTDSDISLAMDDDESITLDVAADSGISLDVPADSGISLDMPADSGLSLDSSATEATIPVMNLDKSSSETLVQMPAYESDDDESEFELGDLEGDSSGDTSVLLFDDDDVTAGSAATVSRAGAESEETFDLEAHDAFDDDDLGDDVFDDDIEDFADDEEFMADDDAFDDEFGGGDTQGEYAAPSPGVAMAPVEQEWGGVVFSAVLLASIAMLLCGGVMIDLVRFMWKSGESGAIAGPLVDMLGR
ncbi:hypothetical protein GC176_23000 [bacterium]|nr:hypothetical protein [bacterium]